MKINFLIYVLVSIFLVFGYSTVHSQEQAGIPEHLKYLRESYEETYTASFDKVLGAVKKFIENEGFRVLNANVKDNDIGKQRAVVRSEICVVTQDPDSVWAHIKRCAVEPPFIRGGVWSSARVQYRFIVNDKGDGTVSVLSRLEYTGWERYITDAPHTFESSGYLEFVAFGKIKELIDKS